MEIAYFLPDNSPVKTGLDKVNDEFAELDLMNNMVYVMFENVGASEDSLSAVLKDVTGGLAPAGIRHNGDYTLFELRPTRRADIFTCKDAILAHFGDSATVELGIEKNMPANITPMILMGATLVFIVLLIMCASFMEVLLFLICTVLAVALNMGSNILMPGVSFLTNTMCAILQMILSMDYCIILMNRYRQERMARPDKVAAMEAAVHGSAPAVLSSALTTIVSLLMLVFMRLKIGADLGIVLAKGVLFSLICNFTVLPALAIWFDRAIFATTKKKMLALPAGALSRFEMKFRVPLSVLFVALFLVAAYLQSKTPISYAAIWETPISKKFPVENPFILLYDNDDEALVPALLDSVATDPHVTSCLSWPHLMVQGYTAGEMAGRFGNLSPLVTEDLLKIVYYAYSHPERTERLSLDQVQAVAEDLSRQGLIPEGLDTRSIMSKLAQDASKPREAPSPASAGHEHSVQQEQEMQIQQPAVPDTVALAVQDGTQAAPPDSAAAPAAASIYTYELATRQMDAASMADLFGVDRSLARTAFRMAGRARKPGTMSPVEMSAFLVTKVLNDKKYSSFINAEQKEQILEIHRLLDSAYVAGPPSEITYVADNSSEHTVVPWHEEETEDSPVPDSGSDTAPVPAESAMPAAVQVPVAEDDPTPLERLAEMSFSGKPYSSAAMWSALHAAGIKVSRADMDLLYLYAGSQSGSDPEQLMTVGELIGYLDGTLLRDPSFSRFVDDDSAQMVSEIREQLLNGTEVLRAEDMSLAVITTDYLFESPETFDFVGRFIGLNDGTLPREHYLISESAMYKEFKDDFPSEKLLLTVLTIAAIFLIVLVTFRTFSIPLMLVAAVMSGVYVNVIVSGWLGGSMYFLAFIIVQSILMGATIDYSILFTSFYRQSRLERGVAESLKSAYSASGHSIMTSGLILTLAPYAMSHMISDRMVAMILRPLSVGALSALVVILFILPGMIAICDRFVAPKGAVRQ